MKRFLVVLFIFILLASAGAYWFYRHALPDIVADAIISQEVPDYLPTQIQRTVEAATVPVNRGAEDIVRHIDEAGIPIDKVLRLIDNTTEEQTYRIIDDLNKTNLKSTDQVFDIVTKHLHADFDLEILRKPFNENTNLKMLEKAIAISNNNRLTKEADIETLKSVAKKVLIEKEKELRRN